MTFVNGVDVIEKGMPQLEDLGWRRVEMGENSVEGARIKNESVSVSS
jgi:hypothetical protein